MGDMLLPLIWIALLVFGVVDVITSEPAAVRNLPKLAWLVVVILLIPPLGTVAWLFLGRPRRESAAPGRAPTGGPAWRSRTRRAIDPADDPQELLARIEARDRQLQRWAEEERAKRDRPDDEVGR